MTQRIFDIYNEKDYADLWDILPERTDKITLEDSRCFLYDKDDFCIADISGIIKINWRDKTEITRPIREVTEQDVGKLCVFWKTNQKRYGTLTQILNIPNGGKLYLLNNDDGWTHCRRLTKQEIEELC